MVRDQVITNAKKKDQLTVSIQHRVIQSPKLRAHIPQSRHLPVKHVEQTGKKDQRPRPSDIGQVAPAPFFSTGNKNDGHTDVEQQPYRSDHIRSQACPDQYLYYRINDLINTKL